MVNTVFELYDVVVLYENSGSAAGTFEVFTDLHKTTNPFDLATSLSLPQTTGDGPSPARGSLSNKLATAFRVKITGSATAASATKIKSAVIRARRVGLYLGASQTFETNEIPINI